MATKKKKATKKSTHNAALKLPATEIRKHSLSIVLTQIERARLTAAAYEQGITISELLRAIVMPHFPEVQRRKRYCGVDRVRLGVSYREPVPGEGNDEGGEE